MAYHVSIHNFLDQQQLDSVAFITYRNQQIFIILCTLGVEDRCHSTNIVIQLLDKMQVSIRLGGETCKRPKLKCLWHLRRGN